MAITVTLAFSVVPERVEEFKTLLKELLPDTMAYDGCQSVDVYSDQDDPGLIYTCGRLGIQGASTAIPGLAEGNGHRRDSGSVLSW